MLKSLILMVQFFTRIPVNINVDFNKDTIGKGIIFLPFIGMLIGGISALVYYILSYINPDIAAFGAVFAIIFLTGGLHLDGLSDTADGFFSARSRERILEIMKDSRIGSFGVVAIVFDILAKYVILKGMESDLAIPAIILSCGTGRAALTMLITFGKSARPGGLGDMFTGNNTKGYFYAGLILFLAAGYMISGTLFLSASGAVLIFSLILMKHSYKLIGGLTGDVYGAACELGEIISMFIFLAVGKWI